MNRQRSRWLAAAAALLAAAATAAPRAPRPAKKSVPAAPSAAITPRRVAAPGDNLKPFVLARPGGGAYLAWAQREGQRTRVLFATSRDGLTYGPPVRVSTETMDLDLGAESGPSMAAGPDGAVYVAWVAGSWSASPAASAAPPAAAGGGHGGGHPPRPANLNIWLARSGDGGRTFSPPVKVNDDPDGAEHRFPTLTVDRRGTVYVAWLDKRKQNVERPDFSRVFFARSTDGGKTFGRNTDATEGQPDPICHCCKLAVAVHPREGLFIAFRNDVNDLRDMFLVHSQDEGATFTKPLAMEDTKWILPT